MSAGRGARGVLGSTVHDLRRQNRGRALRSIALAGETHRAAIAAECGLSMATVTNVVTDLINDGLVRETGSVPSRGGRPITRLSVRPEGGYLLGADIAETGVIVELFDLSLTPIERLQIELSPRTANAAAFGSALTEAVEQIMTPRPRVRDRLIGMGLGVPGGVEHSDGRTTVYAQSLGWGPTDLAELCPIEGLPVEADNGAKTLTMAEQWFGAARGCDDCVVVLIGRGIGAGIISDGRLLRGAGGSSGELGHTKITVGGPRCHCGGRGCLEAHVGGAGLVARWRAAAGRSARPASRGAQRQLFAEAEAGNPLAIRVIDETVELLGIGLANLVNLVNPERIVVGGPTGARLFAARGPQLVAALRSQALDRPGAQCAVVPAAMGVDAVALGAALLPLEQLIAGATTVTAGTTPPGLARAHG